MQYHRTILTSLLPLLSQSALLPSLLLSFPQTTYRSSLCCSQHSLKLLSLLCALLNFFTPTKLIFDSSQTLTSAINQLPAIPIRNNCTPLCCMQPVIYSQKAGYCCDCTANTSYLSLWTIFLPLFHWWKSVFVDSSNVLLPVPSVLYSSDGIGCRMSLLLQISPKESAHKYPLPKIGP